MSDERRQKFLKEYDSAKTDEERDQAARDHLKRCRESILPDEDEPSCASASTQANKINTSAPPMNHLKSVPARPRSSSDSARNPSMPWNPEFSDPSALKVCGGITAPYLVLRSVPTLENPELPSLSESASEKPET